jgi:integrase/recombinase XerD
MAKKGLTKQAKTLSERQIEATVALLSRNNRAQRDTVAFLLSVKAGLRAKEVAEVTWAMVIDDEGRVAGELRLTNDASKGDSGRVIDLNKQLKAALVALHDDVRPLPDEAIVGGTAGAMGCGFCGCTAIWASTACRPTAAGAPRLLAGHGRSPRPAAVRRTSRLWPAMPIWRRRRSTSR